MLLLVAQLLDSSRFAGAQRGDLVYHSDELALHAPLLVYEQVTSESSLVWRERLECPNGCAYEFNLRLFILVWHCTTCVYMLRNVHLG